MVDQAVRKLDSIDILVNNAQALHMPVPLESLSEELWGSIVQTGVKATWYCRKAVFPHMKDRGGR